MDNNAASHTTLTAATIIIANSYVTKVKSCFESLSIIVKLKLVLFFELQE